MQTKQRTRLADGSELCIPGAISDDNCFISRTFEDGECWALTGRLLGAVAITRSFSETHYGWEEEFMYADYSAGLAALLCFNRKTEGEPQGWIRHVPTMRRRPGGDASKETVRH